MARTHNAQPNVQTTSRFYQDGGGELLGKGGEPIPTTVIRGIPTLHPHGAPTEVVQIAPREEVVETPSTPPQEFVWVCDKTTWGRNMDGYALMHILDVMIGPLTVSLTDDEARELPSDCRFHFRRRIRPEPAWDAPDPPETMEDRIARLEAELAEANANIASLMDLATVDESERPMTHGEKIAAGRARAAAMRAAQGPEE
jgi:hypothetical protein